MPNYKVKVKWGKEMFKDVEVNTDEDPLVFKAQLFALTGVLPERQKIVIKGVNLKEWSGVTLKDGTAILLMGSKEEDVPIAPAVKTVFMEDMSESELASALDLPAGLKNLGNTCYMNATVQCLKTVPELREALSSFTGAVTLSANEDPGEAMTAALRELYATMDRTGQEVYPAILLRVLHNAFPRFSARGEGDTYQQQDANECWIEIVRLLQQKLPAKDQQQAANRYKSFVDQYFGGTFSWTMKCSETEEEEPTSGSESFLQLSCFISQDVKYMLSGLKTRLQEQLTKNSPTLSRDAQYIKSNVISRLPAYLTIQFVRFYYKEKGSINAKVLRDVKFPMELDVYELCSPDLQQRLTPMRDAFKKADDALVERKLKQEQTKDETSEKEPEPYWFSDDIGSNNSGFYTLQAVMTHKGRSTASGHYVAWVKGANNTWLKCDDDRVSPVTEEEVLKLSGGGDWHCAYVLLYGPRLLRLTSSD